MKATTRFQVGNVLTGLEGKKAPWCGSLFVGDNEAGVSPLIRGYRFEKKLSASSHSAVYLAKKVSSDREIVLKITKQKSLSPCPAREHKADRELVLKIVKQKSSSPCPAPEHKAECGTPEVRPEWKQATASTRPEFTASESMSPWPAPEHKTDREIVLEIVKQESSSPCPAREHKADREMMLGIVKQRSSSPC